MWTANPPLKSAKEMHDVLLKDFQQDLADKRQADKISLGASKYLKRRRKRRSFSPKRKLSLKLKFLIKNLPSSAPAEKRSTVLKKK